MLTCRGTNRRTASPTSNLVIIFLGFSFIAAPQYFECCYFFFFTKLCLDNNNRVKLLSEPGSAGSDYINASFVSVSICRQSKRGLISQHWFFFLRFWVMMSVCIHRNNPAFPGLSLPQWVHCHPGSSAGHCGWLLEDDLGNRHPHRRHADSVLRERQSECSEMRHGCRTAVARGQTAAFTATLNPVSSAAKVWAPYVFVTFQIRCHKYWPEDSKPMSVFSDILVSKVSEEVFPDWTVRTLKVEKVKLPTLKNVNVKNVPMMWVIRYSYQLLNYWPNMFSFPV